MTPRMVVEPTATVPTDASVRHFDELDPVAQDSLTMLADCGTDTVSTDVASRFEDGELVKFTDYYRVYSV